MRTPLDDARRGGTVTLDVPDSARVAADLIAREVIVDHRPHAGIRIAPHFYTTDAEIDHALAVTALGRVLDLRVTPAPAEH